MVVKFLARAAVTGLLLNLIAGTEPAAAQRAAAAGSLASDSNFIQTAGSLGQLQVKLGKIAQDKGSSAVVRDFGKRMVEEYSKVNEELATGAKQAAYPAPVLLRQHKQVVERFRSMTKGSFDKNYMAEMVSDHSASVHLFQDESESGRVASLKELATKMLPTVQQHETLATQTASSVGADVTASKAEEGAGAKSN
jgi:putative membrane protein